MTRKVGSIRANTWEPLRVAVAWLVTDGPPRKLAEAYKAERRSRPSRGLPELRANRHRQISDVYLPLHRRR
jgi:hypothetical protein